MSDTQTRKPCPHKPGGQAMNERDGTLKFHWSEYAKFREWFATTKWFDDPVYCEIADAAWQAALSAATHNNGTYCIHGIKCALCAEREEQHGNELGAPAGTARELTPLEEALRRREDKNDVSTARHFYISTNQGILPSQVDWTPDGAMAFAEAYAAEQVRQADEGWREASAELEAEIAELRQERDDDEQMWRERCDAASKAGYEVAMEQEREARERAEGALREISGHLQKPHYQGAPLVGDPLTHMLRNIPPHLSEKTVMVDKTWYEELLALAQVKSSESTKGSS